MKAQSLQTANVRPNGCPKPPFPAWTAIAAPELPSGFGPGAGDACATSLFRAFPTPLGTTELSL